MLQKNKAVREGRGSMRVQFGLVRKHLTEKMTFEQKLEGGGEVSRMESGRRKFQIEGRTVSAIHWKNRKEVSGAGK